LAEKTNHRKKGGVQGAKVHIGNVKKIKKGTSSLDLRY